MNKLIMVMALLVLGMTPMVSATLTMTLDNTTANIGDVVVVTISSDVGEEITWGVYLEPVSVYPSDAQLQNPMVLTDAGNKADVIAGSNPDAGHDYMSEQAGPGLPSPGNWSTVEFVGLTAGNYTVKLTDGGSTGTELNAQSIEVIPEPTTIMVLGLGSLLLRRKLRRA